MNQPIMMGPMRPPPLIRQNAVPNFNIPIQNKGTNPIIGIVVVLILCIIIWLVFLKKNGSHSEWSEWSTCDKECGGGQETRTRKYTPAKWGGTDLENKDHIIEYKECNIDPCPIDGTFSDWSNWGQCSKDCGGGTQTRTRTYTAPKHGGQDHPDLNSTLYKYDSKKMKQIDTQGCNPGPCDNDPVKVTPWEDSKDTNGNIIYYDDKTENPNIVDINKINPIESENQNFKVYKKQERTFTKEGKKYIGPETLEKKLSDLLNQPDGITQQDYDKLKDNGGTLIKYKEEDKNKYKFIAYLDNWTNFTNCNPEKGKNRWKQRETTYYFPTGENDHDQEYFNLDFGFSIAKWNSITNLSKGQYTTITDPEEKNKFIFTRENTIEPKKYKVKHEELCEDIRYYMIDDLKKLWKSKAIAGCTTDFNENAITNANGSSLDDYSYSQTGNADLENKILSLFHKDNIIKELNPQTKISQCYGSDYFKVTPEMHILSPNKHLLPSGFRYTWEGTNSTANFEWFNKDKTIKLVFQYDGHLILRGKNTEGNNQLGWGIIWKSGHYASNSKEHGKWYLQISKNFGDIGIFNGSGSQLFATPGTNAGGYGEILDNGRVVTKNKDGKITAHLLLKREKFGDKNIYFIYSDNWKYCKNNASPDGILKNWFIYNKNGELKEHVTGRVTLYEDTHPWGMTEDERSSDDRNTTGMTTPINITQVNEPDKIVHVVLMNKLGERIYIEPQLLLDIYNKGDKTDDTYNIIKCDGDYMDAINAYNIDIDNFINKLENSSVKLQNGLFKNEKGRGVRNPYTFYKDYGAWADPDDRHLSNKDGKCSEWYLVAFDGDSTWGATYKTQKDALKADGFQKARNDIKLHENWLRDPRGSSQYSVYWRVYYRTQIDYVKYLNGPNSPDVPAAFTNKSIFNNKCINDLEYFVNYRIKQKNKSNFSDKLNNAYLEAIM